MKKLRKKKLQKKAKAELDVHAVFARAAKPYLDAEKMMTQHKVNSLLVTDDDGELCGVIQIYDIKL